MIEDKEFLAKSYFIQGIKAHKNNDLKLAKKFYQMALNKNPNYLEVNLNLGILHNQLDEFSDALNYYKKVYEINNNNHLNYYLHLNVLFDHLYIHS